MTRVRGGAAESRFVSDWLKQRFFGLSAFVAVAAILMALALFVGSTGPAEATCTGPSGGVENCAGAGTQSDISYTAPGVTTLNVNTLTIDPSRISLTGSGASPAAATEVQHYTCSTGNAASRRNGCIYTVVSPSAKTGRASR